MTPEKSLWQQVVFQAFRDATNDIDKMGSVDQIRAKRDAVFWITHGGYDFRFVCTNAGFDPDFLREAFLAGRINNDALKNAHIKN